MSERDPGRVVDTTRGQRWGSQDSRRRVRDEQAAAVVDRKERAMVGRALDYHTDRNPGAVVEVGSDRALDLSGESGHILKVITDSGSDRNGRLRKRVRVLYFQFGEASDVTEVVDGERVPAGDLTPADVHPSCLGTYVKFIPSEPGETLSEHVDRVESYIRERWVPDWNERERVSGQMGDPSDD